VNDVDVAVIGAGQAGLSAAYFLRRWSIDHVVLDHAEGPGGAWRDRWPSLRLGNANRIHSLPGLPFGSHDQDAPASTVVAGYFGDYERLFDIPVRRPVDVRSVSDDGVRLVMDSSAGEWRARAIINATGTWERPFWPYYPGREIFLGTQLHTADYVGPQAFQGKRVVVVGGGISAVQLLTEIAGVADTTWVTRREPVFDARPFSAERGRAAVAMVEEAVAAGRPPSSVVSVTGLPLTPAVEAAMKAGVLVRRPMFTSITPTGVRFADGTEIAAEVILWATGFRAALDHLAPLRLRGAGGGITMQGTQVAGEPRLHLVGYGPSASTIGATRAGRFAVREIRRYLSAAPVSASQRSANG
jgi:cation diffusion facilitator CzcD-associated flavoprotein CzcO